MKRIGDYEGVHFTLGPISIHQFTKFYDVGGINGLRLFQYIKTLQGLTKEAWVKVENKNSYKWFGLSQSTKWRAIKKLKEAKLIEVKGSMGRAPRIKIIAPQKKLN